MDFKKKIFQNYINLRGLSVSKKIVVIESDDWGSIRMPSKEVYEKLRGSGIKIENCPYSRYDSLETDTDYDYLFETLNKIKDSEGKSPIITANFLTSNPDFEKMRADDHSVYHYKNINVTYAEAPNSGNVMSKIGEGINNKFLKPQFHGREHLNVKMWLHLLRENEDIKLAFKHDFFALSFANSNTITLPYLASFMPYEKNDRFDDVIEDGLTNFNQLFNRPATSFIGPVYVWDENIEEQLSRSGVDSIQGLYKQNNFPVYNEKPGHTYRFLKNKTKFEQLQLVRNCFFEPSTKNNFDWVNKCLSDIDTAFVWKRPAIICSHRLNYMGRLNEQNRSENLKKLTELLNAIVKKWPDVVFVSSDEVKNYL